MSESAYSKIRVECLYNNRLVPCYVDRPRHLDDMFRRSLAARGDAMLVEDDRRAISYAQAQGMVNQLAHALVSNGIGRGDRVVLFLGNSAEFIIALLALWRLGAIAVPVGIRQSGPELDYILRQSGATGIFFDDNLLPVVESAVPDKLLRVHVRVSDQAFDGATKTPEFWAFLAGGAADDAQADFDDQTPACIMYTSGTTGKPKGAVLSHLGFFHTAKNYQLTFGYRADDRMLLVIPGTHISGLLAVIVVMLQVGGCVVCSRQFKASSTLQLIAERGITSTVFVPAMYNLIVLEPNLGDYDLTRWRIGHFGGAAMPEITIAKLAEMVPGLELYNGFGATETTSAVTLTPTGDAAKHPKSVGKVLPCVDIRILDPDGREVAPGDAGELWIRSPGNAIGYWENPEATCASFVSGYWRSGDIGTIDADGYVYVFDRLKDMIVRGGFKVYCVELENELLAYPGVVEAAVVPSPCPVLGERIHAFLCVDREIAPEAVRAYCRERLADYKTPDYITYGFETLPRNLNGKIVKQPLRERARAMANSAQ